MADANSSVVVVRDRAIGVIFTATIFLSASLLFFVQPMFAKMVLPNLGGAPAVWTTAMLFFQSALLAGYAYAHFVSTRLTIRRQVAVHALVWALGLVFLPIAVPGGWSFDPAASPILQTLALFAVAVGLPFFALAANAPLLQKWYARSGGEAAGDPYYLYAASNAGSMLALLAFPFVAEPLMGARAISVAWASGYLALGLFLALCARGALLNAPATDAPRALPPRYAATSLQIAKWVGLAFVPSSLMLGTAALISSDLGAFPLVWVIPLALYLLTFVFAFSARFRPPEGLVIALFLVSVSLSTIALATNTLVGLGWLGFAVLFAAFFSVALLFHMRLYDSRPPEAGLTPFYFAMAFGGALGGFFNSVVAPMVFDRALEAPIVLAVAGFALGGAIRPARDILAALAAVAVVAWVVIGVGTSGLVSKSDTLYVLGSVAIATLALLIARRRPAQFVLTAAGLLILGQALIASEGTVYRGRSFFGAYVVRDNTGAGLRELKHGTTQHGLEFIDDLGGRPSILSYYHPNTPLGQIFRSGAVGPGARVGVVGLGVGALACYAQPGQAWRFYEIDPLIDRIARNPALFSFMDECATAMPTILGDARISLAREEGPAFDVLVIDAYSSDAIPVHLITTEALQLYLDRLAPGGLLAMHISNRYFDLASVLGRAADELGLAALEQNRLGTAEVPIARGESPSHVVILARDPAALARFREDGRWRRLENTGGPLWTDDHASLLDAL